MYVCLTTEMPTKGKELRNSQPITSISLVKGYIIKYKIFWSRVLPHGALWVRVVEDRKGSQFRALRMYLECYQVRSSLSYPQTKHIQSYSAVQVIYLCLTSQAQIDTKFLKILRLWTRKATYSDPGSQVSSQRYSSSSWLSLVEVDFDVSGEGFLYRHLIKWSYDFTNYLIIRHVLRQRSH